ncbi:pyridoxal phosphate-dependent aminotransferase [Desulfofustis glycolicus]|uniref:Aminotransferase n=1 Tax=Desulfofustis glycolicus DSM 9705 TaxID=1121409 RepID=A0A1M5XN01_9BACT|nr:pyridoxal phosphate-dependent aminotransferase [Desulfofustis glycolicus]MCB2216625.1 pyridoxal phosphate-dependent aminotransferase [Desulfobulbaceae bacterium]SHI00924.1 aspartate aminotransferase [Desulfofustis glycolicus DSM 9705]
MAISEKMKQFSAQSSWIRKMFEEGAKLKIQYGADQVCDFSLGNPDVPPPPQFREILQETARDTTPGQHSYMPNGGLPWVREAIAARMSTEQGVTIDHGDLLMACGAAGALNVVMKALLNPGEEVIVLAPYFVEYGFYIDNHGGSAVVVHTDGEFNLDLPAIAAAITEKTRAIIINSPNNPTGQVYDGAAISALGDLLEEVGNRFGSTIYLISDEPYRKIVFDGCVVPPIFQLVRNSIVLSSFSKDLSLPGERIGYLAVHPQADDKTALLDAMTLATRILGFVNAPAFMQRVVAELQDVSSDTSIYARRRELFCSLLADIGYQFLAPKGAFYLFPKTPIDDDVRFCALLQEEKILAVPGRGFGSPGHMRLAFCTDDQVIARSAAGFKTAFDRARE